jgi:hypothetical protein
MNNVMASAAKANVLPLTISNARNSSKPILEEIRKSIGVIPNLIAGPVVSEGYRALAATVASCHLEVDRATE